MKKLFKTLLCLCMTAVLLTAAVIPAAYAFNDDPMNGKIKNQADFKFTTPDDVSEYFHDSRFDTGYTIEKVIDVSRHNGNIDWSKVAASGIKYAIIRAGYRGYGDEGSINIDSNFSSNIKGAINAGLKVGVYFYTQAVNEKEAREEADFVLENIIGYDLALPVAFDCEFASDSSGYTGRFYNANLSKSQTSALCKAFCDRVSAAGYDAMVYANPYMFSNHIDASKLGGYDVWLANYTTKTTYAGDYIMWQFSSKETVDGISGNVDMSFYYVKEGVTPSYLRLHASKLTVEAGETTQVAAFFDSQTFTSLGCTVGNIEYNISSTEIASINSDGTVNCFAEGNLKITASVLITFPDINNTGSPQTTSLNKSVDITITPKGASQDDSDNGSDILTMLLNIFKALADMFVKLISALAAAGT